MQTVSLHSRSSLTKSDANDLSNREKNANNQTQDLQTHRDEKRRQKRRQKRKNSREKRRDEGRRQVSLCLSTVGSLLDLVDFAFWNSFQSDEFSFLCEEHSVLPFLETTLTLHLLQHVHLLSVVPALLPSAPHDCVSSPSASLLQVHLGRRPLGLLRMSLAFSLLPLSLRRLVQIDRLLLPRGFDFSSQACSPVDAAGALCRSRTEQVTPGTNGVAQFLQALHLSSECSRRECLRLIAVALRINARDKASERKTFETLPCTKKFTWWCTALGRGTGELGPTERGAPEEREDDDEEEEREDDDEEEEREDDDEEEREDDEEEEREDDDEEQEREDDDEEEEREDDDEEEEREDDDEEEEREDDDEEEEREDDDEEEERADDDEEEEREDDDEEEREEEEKGEDEEEKCV
ncbi:hypothetical protein TGP89_367140 [Toxoplasma gondii p89]|uniref:Uncharacterized protein n=1 Tax=Toxoplasma gondii p89 TaxID=943119 RepID=A0A086JYB9_TOXGO|nr:hypothetical protein TGP89_367140 [Toxoplasma gondii p89]